MAEESMTYRGHVENGAVVFDEAVVLPEGTTVRVDVLDDAKSPRKTARRCTSG